MVHVNDDFEMPCAANLSPQGNTKIMSTHNIKVEYFSKY